MKRVVAVAAAIAALAAVTASSASADHYQYSIATCFNAGTMTVPQGADVAISAGWVAATPGLVRAFMQKETTTFSVNGEPLDPNPYYAPVVPFGDVYWSKFLYEFGVITAPTRISLSVSIAHPLPDLVIFDDAGKPVIYNGTVLAGSCTIVPS